MSADLAGTLIRLVFFSCFTADISGKPSLAILVGRLEINEEYGVIQLTSPRGYNRMNLKLYDSIVLLILRILYDEKKRELSE